MFHAMLICSDGDCDDAFEAWGTLADLETLACDCGCTLEILSLDEAEEGDARLELQLVR
jgi:hypothetical protein